MQKQLERIELLKKTIEHNLTEEKLKIIKSSAEETFELIKAGGLVLACGNGGSHSLAEHLTGELNWRLDKHRFIGIPSVCIGSNVSAASAIVNDSPNVDNRFVNLVFPFSKIDIPKVLICFTTSLTSKNIIKIAELARTYPNIADRVVVFLGEDRSKISKNIFHNAEFLITVDAPDERFLQVEIIQEVQTVYMHLYCDFIYEEIVRFSNLEREKACQNEK